MLKLQIHILSEVILLRVESRDYLQIVHELELHIQNVLESRPIWEEIYFWYAKIRIVKNWESFELQEYIETKDIWITNISRALAFWKRQKEFAKQNKLPFNPIKFDDLVACWGTIFSKKINFEMIRYDPCWVNSWWYITWDDFHWILENFHAYHLVKQDSDIIDLLWLPPWTSVTIESLSSKTEITFNSKILES